LLNNTLVNNFLAILWQDHNLLFDEMMMIFIFTRTTHWVGFL